MRIRALLVAALTSVMACNDNTTSNAIVVGTDQVVAVGFADAISQEVAFFWVVAESFDPTMVNATVAATDVARTASAFFSPVGCISRTANGNTVTLRATKCAGPMGLNNTTGAVLATIDEATNAKTISLSSSTVKSTTLNLQIDATAAYTQTGTARLLTVSSLTNHQMAQYTVSWQQGGDCATVDGTVVSPQSNGLTATNTFSGYVICRTGCPRSGTVTRQDPSTGVTVTTTYNGSASASFSRSDGQTGTLTLACQ
jgi:hypothetical protein